MGCDKLQQCFKLKEKVMTEQSVGTMAISFKVICWHP